jgi:hypothetical protein
LRPCFALLRATKPRAARQRHGSAACAARYAPRAKYRKLEAKILLSENEMKISVSNESAIWTAKASGMYEEENGSNGVAANIDSKEKLAKSAAKRKWRMA